MVLLRYGRQPSLPQSSPCGTRAKGILDLLSQIRLRAPVFHTGERQHVSTAGSLAPREATLPSAPLREPFLPRPPDDARSALPILALACVLRGKRRARTPCLPFMPHYHAAGGGVALLSIPASLEDSANGNAARPLAWPLGSLRSGLRRSRISSTLFWNRARGEEFLTRRRSR